MQLTETEQKFVAANPWVKELESYKEGRWGLCLNPSPSPVAQWREYRHADADGFSTDPDPYQREGGYDHNDIDWG